MIRYFIGDCFPWKSYHLTLYLLVMNDESQKTVSSDPSKSRPYNDIVFYFFMGPYTAVQNLVTIWLRDTKFTWKIIKIINFLNQYLCWKLFSELKPRNVHWKLAKAAKQYLLHVYIIYSICIHFLRVCFILIQSMHWFFIWKIFKLIRIFQNHFFAVLLS